MPRVARRRFIDAPVDGVWALVSDPHGLPRWWPRTTRIENLEHGDGGRLPEWTKVLETSEGRGLRADFRCTASVERERYAWEQQIEGTPFERHLRSMDVTIEMSPQAGGTDVEISVRQTLRGLSRLGSLAMRRAQGAMLEEALDGMERAVGSA